jgi:hypothetical protein
MSAIHDVDVDLATFCGRIGNLYGRHGLCPPFELRRVAAEWKANGIALSHVVAVIDRHLSEHRRRYHSGSGDALFSWVGEIIRKTWREQHFSSLWAQATPPMMQRFPDRDWVDRQPSSKRKQPQRIDQAIAFLRRELADGEVAATRLEENAKASGISLRTLDRARARLKVISRRTGFAKEGKCWLSLARTP